MLTAARQLPRKRQVTPSLPSLTERRPLRSRSKLHSGTPYWLHHKTLVSAFRSPLQENVHSRVICDCPVKSATNFGKLRTAPHVRHRTPVERKEADGRTCRVAAPTHPAAYRSSFRPSTTYCSTVGIAHCALLRRVPRSALPRRTRGTRANPIPATAFYHQNRKGGRRRRAYGAVERRATHPVVEGCPGLDLAVLQLVRRRIRECGPRVRGDVRWRIRTHVRGWAGDEREKLSTDR